ncbi:MAG: histidine kinase dimerization/phospho-acceptor domain-containing protein, partial [Culicoidibacterales bacterium]
MKKFYQKIRERVYKLSILYKFTFVITLVFLVCFLALTALAQPVATNLAIEYAHRSMTQRLKIMRTDGFIDGEINELYARSLIQTGELFSVQKVSTGEEIFQINEIEAFIPEPDLANITNQHVIRVETVAETEEGEKYLLIMYADISATTEPYLNAYYRYIVPLISTNGLLLTLAGVFTVMYLTRRIQTFTEKMRLIRENGYQEELPNVYSQDEIGEMIAVFNEMICHFQELHEAQKQFVSDASHELKTPLAIIEGNAQLIEKWGKKDPQILDESIPALRRGVDRARMLIDDLLMLSRMGNLQEGKILPLHLEGLIVQYVKDLEIVHPDVSFELELESITY